MSTRRPQTLDEAIEAGLEYMQEQFDLIKAQLREPDFLNKCDDEHCAAFGEILKVRDQILTIKRAFAIPKTRGGQNGN